MVASVLLLLAAQAAGTSFSPPVMTDPTPGGSLLSVFREGDYPADALAAKQGGVVSVQVHLDTSGRVDRCTIAGSSGVSSLDKATCDIIRARARFNPAHGPDGKAVEVELEQAVAWQASKPVPGELLNILSVVRAAEADGKREGSAPVPVGLYGAPDAGGNLVSLFSADDYPAEAMLKHETGTVTVRLAIDAQGKIAGCDVTKSAGSASLDAATCRVLTERARFKPALDRAGKPTADAFTQTVRWQLPADTVTPEPVGRAIFAILPGNKAGACRMELEGPLPPEVTQDAVCKALQPLAEQVMANEPSVIDRTGQELAIERGQLVGSADALPAGQRSGEVLVSHWAVEMDVLPDGQAVTCKAASWSPLEDEDLQHLCPATMKQAASGGATRKISRYEAIYFRSAGK